MNRFKALMTAELLFMTRNKMSYILGIGMPVGFFILMSNIFQTDQQSSVNLLMSMAAFSSISFAIFTLPMSFLEDKQTKWLQRLMYTPVTLVQYYIVRICRVILSFSLAIMTVFIVGRMVKNVQLSMQQWVMLFILLLVGSLCMVGIGLMFTLISSHETLAISSNIMYMLLGILGGLWFPLAIFPKWLQAIGHWFPSYHMVHLAKDYLEKYTINMVDIGILLMYGIVGGVLTYAFKKMKRG